jgi:inhibitor of cysteine peptidase
VKVFDDQTTAIKVSADTTFAIALASNPTTGYTWQATVPSHSLELLDQKYEAGSTAVGGAGREVFRFRARERGQVDLVFKYRRPWTRDTRDTQHFRVTIAS